MEQVFDVIIIGGGPAGYTAGIYTSRAQLSTLIIGGATPGGQLMLTTEVENYPGFSKGILGPELIQEMTTQAEKFGSKIIYENVDSVDFSEKIKKVKVGNVVYQGKTVIVTVGAKARALNVGEEKLMGRGVSPCATCDAAFFKEKITFVVGGGDVAMEDALALTKFAKSVTLVHRRDSFRASKIMQARVLEEKKLPVLWNSEVVRIKGEQKLEAIVIKDLKTGVEKEFQADGLFLAIGHIPASDFIKGAIQTDDHGYVITNMIKSGIEQREIWREGYPTQTSVEGVFAAGDVVDFHYRQAVTSAAMGCQAALDVEKYLTGNIAGW
jgi:thioredoxin reductase (NADPH)